MIIKLREIINEYNENPLKIYLDDVRKGPEDWVTVRTVKEVIDYLENDNIVEISLDHDLGDDSKGTGYDVLKWIEEQVHYNEYDPPKISIHTANPPARVKMELAVNTIKKTLQKRETTDKLMDILYKNNKDGKIDKNGQFIKGGENTSKRVL